MIEVYVNQSWHLWRNKRSLAGPVPYMWNAFDETWATSPDEPPEFAMAHVDMLHNSDYHGPCTDPRA